MRAAEKQGRAAGDCLGHSGQAKAPRPTKDARGQRGTAGSQRPSRHRNHTERWIVVLVHSDFVQRLIRTAITGGRLQRIWRGVPRAWEVGRLEAPFNPRPHRKQLITGHFWWIRCPFDALHREVA